MMVSPAVASFKLYAVDPVFIRARLVVVVVTVL
jgi:hypothetical protein